MSVIVGIDVGGTFTDLFRFDPATRSFTTAKVPSRRGDEARAHVCRGFTCEAPASDPGTLAAQLKRAARTT